MVTAQLPIPYTFILNNILLIFTLTTPIFYAK
jgi:hypothetical protein